MTERALTVDPAEAERFRRLADSWWDENGPLAPLHKLNPPRIAFLKDNLHRYFSLGDRPARASLKGLSILDVGCGGGLLAEPLCRLGAEVTAIDPVHEAIRAAQAHAELGGLVIDYRATSLEALVDEGARFDVITAMEVIEHVAEPDHFVRSLSRGLKPRGCLVLSTINRTPRAFAEAIVGAEWLLGWLPRGSHSYSRLIKPSELARWCRASGLMIERLAGMSWVADQDRFVLSKDVGVNYLAFARS
ncbi:MAG: bifunctional 2-polyprenyl-6-hydroxyphenol methylase/3-demethylubiquinol 3-O-methyltransferase UbiG [Geminicoccaceae bacterium]